MASAEHPDGGFEPRIGRSVSLDHAAEILGVSRRTIYNRIRDGRLQTIRTLGGSQRVLIDSVTDTREIGRPPTQRARRRHEQHASFVRSPGMRSTSHVRPPPFLPDVAGLPRLLRARSCGPCRGGPQGAAQRRPGGSPRRRLARRSTSSSTARGRRWTRSSQRYNLRVRKLLKSGAVLRVTAGQLEALQQDEAVGPPVGRHPLPVDGRRRSRSRSAPTRCGPARRPVQG